MDDLRLLALLAHLGPGPGPSLAALARRARVSRFHLHRVFRKRLRETPRQYAQGRRLEHAAGQLLLTDERVLDIALAAGYGSHEVFTRAFRRHFGCTPAHYRQTMLASAGPEVRARHAAWTSSIGRCMRLFHWPTRPPIRSLSVSTMSISRQERPAQPLLLIRRRIARNELQAMLAECFGTLFSHGMTSGLAIAGAPLARFVSTGPGVWTVEAAMPLATAAAASGEMQPGTLPGGPVALAVHAGPYEQLPDAHAAIERWIEAQGFSVAGAPWESYITDPGQYPDPRDWRTEICWPLAP
jgi:AraC family transcriptional regulator